MSAWNAPARISGHTLRNRIVFPAVTGNWASSAGAVTPKLVAFYREVAAGGCGMTIVGGTSVTPDGKSSSHALCLDATVPVEGFAHLASAIRSEGSFSCLQLMHVGGQGNPEFSGAAPVSPSSRDCCATGARARPLTEKEVTDLCDCFVMAASRASEAGFEGIELHMAHGYLLHEFLSPTYNHRTDQYGGTREGRLRLPLEIVSRIRKTLPKLVIGARISARDFTPDGLDEDENRHLVPCLESAGISYFNVTAGTYDTSPEKHKAMADGRFWVFSRAIRGMTRMPVIGGGKVLDLQEAGRMLDQGAADLVALGRALIADPALVRKSGQGAPQIRCNGCGECHYLRNGTPHMTCSLRMFPDA